MPSMYAHQRFGDIVFEKLPGKLQEKIKPHEDLYNIGLQGPDILFYYNPILWNEIPQYGNRLHDLSGRVFFTKALQNYYRDCTEGSGLQDATRIYLYGVLCHYSLDSICHPYVDEVDASGITTHAGLEGDYDRHLIELQGKDPAKEKITEKFHPSKEAARAIAPVYGEASEKQILRSIRLCVIFQDLVRCPHDLKRNVLLGALRIIGKYDSLKPHIMSKEPDPVCAEADQKLDELFESSIPLALGLLQELDANMENTAFSEGRAKAGTFFGAPEYELDFSGVRRA